MHQTSEGSKCSICGWTSVYPNTRLMRMLYMNSLGSAPGEQSSVLCLHICHNCLTEFRLPGDWCEYCRQRVDCL